MSFVLEGENFTDARTVTDRTRKAAKIFISEYRCRIIKIFAALRVLLLSVFISKSFLRGLLGVEPELHRFIYHFVGTARYL